MNDEKNIEKELAKVEIAKEKKIKKILSKKNIERLANSIADEVASNCRYVIPCKMGEQCESGIMDFDCESAGLAFDCSNKFTCGGGSGSHNFGCDGGSFDDYECGRYFHCPKSFHCSTSFDDEDCEGAFGCSNPAFTCTGNEYN